MAVATQGRFEMVNELKLNCLKARLYGIRTYSAPGEPSQAVEFLSALENIALTTPTQGTSTLSSQIQFDVNFDNFSFEEITIQGIQLLNSAGDTQYLTASFAQNFVYESEGFFNLTALSITML